MCVCVCALVYVCICEYSLFSWLAFLTSVAFDNMQQQDAHEFLNYLLNTIADLLEGEMN